MLEYKSMNIGESISMKKSTLRNSILFLIITPNMERLLLQSKKKK